VVEVEDLLAASKEEDDGEVVADSPAARSKGWARMALQVALTGMHTPRDRRP
jgi:hypothetical protein